MKVNQCMIELKIESSLTIPFKRIFGMKLFSFNISEHKFTF